MARGRMISTTIAEDAEFNNLSLEAQLVYLRTIPHLDRDGLINGHPSILWGKVSPLMPDLLSTMAAIIEEMVSTGLVIRYTHAKTQILFFKGFTKNQIGMRYEREPASIFPIPTGYKRTNEGLTLITDTPNNDNLPTPPTISEPPKQPLPPTNGALPHDESKQDLPVTQTSGNVPANFRQASGNLPPEENRIEENRREGNTRACETDEREAQEIPPPTSFQSKPNEYMPGITDPRQRWKKQRNLIAERLLEIKSFGMTQPQFNELVNAVLDGCGKRELADSDIGDTLTEAQDTTVELVRLNERFRTVEGIECVFNSWQETYPKFTTPPIFKQLKEHAGLMVSGKLRKKSEQADKKEVPKLLSFKEWCLSKYHVDRPKFASVSSGVPEATINEQYRQYVTQQQAH